MPPFPKPLPLLPLLPLPEPLSDPFPDSMEWSVALLLLSDPPFSLEPLPSGPFLFFDGITPLPSGPFVFHGIIPSPSVPFFFDGSMTLPSGPFFLGTCVFVACFFEGDIAMLLSSAMPNPAAITSTSDKRQCRMHTRET